MKSAPATRRSKARPAPARPVARGGAPCFHGGAFFDAVGDGFDDLTRFERIVNADVLDAWFPPAPAVLSEVREHFAWLSRTSPPTHCAGLLRAIARARGVPETSLLAGAGSSALIYLALGTWLDRRSRCVVLDPTYGEYLHVLENVVGCEVDRFELERACGYEVDLEALAERIERARPDWVVLVNPNSPTGRHVDRTSLEAFLARVPPSVGVWIDETYVDYIDSAESVERYAARSPNVVVCKSMSKAYALSGMRVAYLCGDSRRLDELRAKSPPWAVSLPAQVAAVRALQDPNYYAVRWAQTRKLRRELVDRIAHAIPGATVLDGAANFVLAHLPDEGPTSAEVVAACRRQGVFVRDVSSMGRALGERALRIAVKRREDNERVARALETIATRSLEIRPLTRPRAPAPCDRGPDPTA